jgi:transcriptional regulator with XRE-family HTH domain
MTDDAPLLIQKLRLQRGWSQEQLAEIAGLSVRTIQRIERGQTPSAESLKALAAVLEVDFGALREAHMTPSAAQSASLSAASPCATSGVSAEEALAFARVRKLKRFYMHVVQYVVIIAFLAVVNLLTFPRYLWVGWAALGWDWASPWKACASSTRSRSSTATGRSGRSNATWAGSCSSALQL